MPAQREVSHQDPGRLTLPYRTLLTGSPLETVGLQHDKGAWQT